MREARVSDADEMGRVMVTTWLVAHRSQMPFSTWERRRDQWTPEVSARAWVRVLRERDAVPDQVRDCFLVAEDDRGTMIAVAMGSVNRADPSAILGKVHALYVDPSHHKRGIGRRLVQQLSAFLADQGATSVQIGVLTANQEARRFYEALGGQLAGETLFDEDGDLLPESIYVWPDISSLLDRSLEPDPHSRADNGGARRRPPLRLGAPRARAFLAVADFTARSKVRHSCPVPMGADSGELRTLPRAQKVQNGTLRVAEWATCRSDPLRCSRPMSLAAKPGLSV
ncbi:MAG: GNAT family N-acetyltransferase [Propionibacteriaceae bacterium]|nr:GNAT family N-acetyltransferase [Propionibacteriaceae bacterium]